MKKLNEKNIIRCMDALVPVERDRLAYLDSVTGAVKNIKNAMPFLYGHEADEQAIANAVKNYKAAWKNCKELHTGVPTFKKRSYEQSYQTNAHYYQRASSLSDSNVRFKDRHHVTLPKLEKVCFDGSPQLVQALLKRTAGTRISTISRDPVGEYWASFAITSSTSSMTRTGMLHPTTGFMPVP